MFDVQIKHHFLHFNVWKINRRILHLSSAFSTFSVFMIVMRVRCACVFQKVFHNPLRLIFDLERAGDMTFQRKKEKFIISLKFDIRELNVQS